MGDAPRVPSLDNESLHKAVGVDKIAQVEKGTPTGTIATQTSLELGHLLEDDYPDGGLKAWLVVSGGVFVTLSTFGYINAWGTFQAYYEEHILNGTSPSTISWIGSVQYSLIFLPALISGRLFDIGYFKVALLVSSIILVACTFLIAECTEYWQFLLCQGIGIGVTSGVVFGPTMGIIGHWFKKKRATALGFIAIGSSTGGTIFPVIFSRLVPQIGFKWTMRVIAFILLACLGFANLVLERRLPPTNVSGGLMNIRQFKNVAYSLYTAAGFISFLGLYTLLTYIDASAPSQGVSSNLVPYMVAIANTGSALGRLMTGMLGDRYGILNIMVPSNILAGLFTIIWPFVHGNGPVITVTVLYGVFSGAFVGLIAGPIMAMGPVGDVGRRTGMYFTVMALGALAGPPISGAIENATGSYKAVGIYAGAAVLVGAICLLISRYMVLGGWHGRF